MENIKEPGPTPLVMADVTVRFLRQAEHARAGRPPEARTRLLASIQRIEAEVASFPVVGIEDASENLDQYLY